MNHLEQNDKIRAYVKQARESGAPENLITKYEIYACFSDDGAALKTFYEWLRS